MVNGREKRQTIISILKKESWAVSGEFLAKQLKISRVAVWKHIEHLRTEGYNIRSTPRGYQFRKQDDFLAESEFMKEDGVDFYPALSSTMDTARDLAHAGVEEGHFVLAGSQHHGQGRGDHSWNSPSGGLYGTMILYPVVYASGAPLYTLAGGIALCRILDDLYGIKGSVKWPNDVLIQEKKVAGILSEYHSLGERIQFLNLGIGVNCTRTPEGTCIAEHTGKKIDRKELLFSLRNTILELTGDHSIEMIPRLWEQLWNKPPGQLRFPAAGITGIPLKIDSCGNLIIRRDQSEHLIRFGTTTRN